MSNVSPLLKPLVRPLTRAITEAGVGWDALIPTPTRFVSSAATNGFAIGANAGAGNTKSAPWLTLDYAIANATTGDVIMLNDGDYTAATFYNVTNKSLTIVARAPGLSVAKAASGQTRIFNLNITASHTLRLMGLVLDGLSNTTRGITAGGSAVALGVIAGVNLFRCTIKDCTSSYIEFPSQKSVAFTVNGLALSGTISGRGIFVNSAQDGSVSINAVTYNTVCSGTDFAAIEVLEATGSTGLSVSISSVSGSYTTANAAATLPGIIVKNVDDAQIRGCSLTISGGLSGTLYSVLSTSATLTAHRAVISGNGGYHGGDSGFGILVGTNGSTIGNGNHNDPIIQNNTITANVSAALPIHGIMVGFGSGGTISGNTVSGAGYGLLAKDWVGGEFADNTCDNFTQDGMYAKGCTNTEFRSNTINVSIPNAGGTVLAAWDDVTAVYSTGIVFEDNIINVDVDPPQIVMVQTGNDAAFARNTYNVNTAISPAAWSYQGTDYDTLAEWKAGVEPTALP